MHKYLLHTRSFFYHVALFFKGIKVFALVGKTGTGKSFRAKLIAQKFGIELIIDDGLLIRDKRILGGESAKKEKRSFSAVKTALFSNQQRAQEIKKILQHEDFKKILIIATSIKMARRIAYNLGLPHPNRIIKIEDIATEGEIEAATRSRRISGKHVIPVPAIEVKRDYSHIFLESIQILLKRRFFLRKGRDRFEKTIVRPEYSMKGKVAISEAALSQMVMHCVNVYSPAFEIDKIVVVPDKAGYKLEVILQVPFGMKLAGEIQELQFYILNNIEQFTGLDLQEVNVTVGKISKRRKKEVEKSDEQAEIQFSERH